jgi:GMP synthase-like glutamine amidotransferase/tetratricopeptide (TPR) repeat protein
MPVRALALEHLRDDPVGVFGDVMTERGIDVDRVLLSEGMMLPDWREYDLMIAMGAGVSVWQEDEHPWIAPEKRAVREAVLAGVPYFGICFGVQLLAEVLGARSFAGPEPEIGVNQVFLTAAARHDPVFRGFPADLEVCEWHSNHFSLPPGAVRLARSPRYANQAIRYGRVAYGMQCHLEPSLEDIHGWLTEFPESAIAFERRHGTGSVERLLEDYADFVPFLQQTARQVFGRWLENALSLGGLEAAVRTAPNPSGQGLWIPAATTTSGPPLIGRTAELARIETAVSAARLGESAVLVLRGEGGIGKTSLLDAAADRAAGLRVVRVGGADVADALGPFAGLMSLLASVARGTPTARPVGRTDRFAVYASAVRLIVRSASDIPVLLLIDDADLLDDPSAEAIAFIARRLGMDGVSLIVATESEQYLSDFESLALARLEPPDARSLLEAHWGSKLTPWVADQVVAAADGNPLALLEIPVGLTAEQRAETTPIDEFPVSAEWEFLRRATALPPAARQALLVAAVAGDQRRNIVSGACRGLGLTDDAIVEAESSGLLVLAADRVIFRHSLARMAVTYSALRADRRAAHRALGDVLQGPASTWHQARAASHADEAVASELERLARANKEEGAFAGAADAFERAARLSPDEQERGRRLLEAAHAAHLAGHVNAAIDHVGAVLRSEPPEKLRREADHLHGRILARSGSADAARDRLVSAADRCERDDPALAARMLTDAVLPALRAGGPARAVQIARRAARVVPTDDGSSARSAQIALGTALIFAGEYLDGTAAVSVAASDGHIDDLGQRMALGAALALAGCHDRAREVIEEIIDEARSTGTVSVLPYALIRLADVDLETGRWTAAASGLHEAHRLASETGQSSDQGLALGTLAWLEAARGNEARCRAYAQEALELAGRLGGGSRLDRAATAVGLLELGRGYPDRAISYLDGACRLQDEQGWSDAGRTPHRRPDLIEAFVLAGRDDEARTAFGVFHREAERTQRPSGLAAAARCRALLAGPEEQQPAFEEALRVGDGAADPFEYARTELLYGEALISAGKPERTVTILATALDRFERLGAEPWAERARSGIRGAGGHVPARVVSLTDRLSAPELEVAVAAAGGGSTAEIAERLLLGHRTVQYRLASAAIKLGLDSPSELSDCVRRELR